MSDVIGYPCSGGPLDGQLLAHPAPTYRVAKLPPAELSPYPGPAPSDFKVKVGEYRLESVGRGRMAWVFQGWPE